MLEMGSENAEQVNYHALNKVNVNIDTTNERWTKQRDFSFHVYE